MNRFPFLLFAALCVCGAVQSAAAFGPDYSVLAADGPTVLADEANNTASPDRTMEAFTSGNDLYVRNLQDSSVIRLTFDGTDLILNGYASWVYYEEILGRASNYRAFWWSPDSRKLAFYRFDNSEVPMFPIFSPFGQNGSLNLTRYPKAGETNPSVKVGIIDIAARTVLWAGFDYDEDQYFGVPFWGPASDELYVPREPRRQNTLDLYAVSVSDGSLRGVYHEEYPTWVDWIDGMLFSETGGFYMARSFESGWQQIYRLDYEGNLLCLTSGANWDIRLLREDNGNLWFTAKRDSRLHNTLYRLDRRGRIVALTDPSYNVSRIEFSEDGKTFTAVQSNARTPYTSISGRCDKFSVSVTEEAKERPEDVPVPEIIRIKNDGYELYGLISLPRDFDPQKQYPVVMQMYGGPGTPYVRDVWMDRDASDRWCYENGIIYLVCDPRSSGENGRKGMDEAFGRMTVVESDDYVAWAKWLATLPYVDEERIGAKGYSFGGTSTAMLVLSYPEYFRCGIANMGVYDWTLYDSHYTERFMDTPQANPEGYEVASVLQRVRTVFDGEKQPLPGALRITHGTGDDNVHYQNALMLVDALQQVGYQFELMLYPDGMHGYRNAQRRHEQEAEGIFWTKWLLE